MKITGKQGIGRYQLFTPLIANSDVASNIEEIRLWKNFTPKFTVLRVSNNVDEKSDLLQLDIPRLDWVK